MNVGSLFRAVDALIAFRDAARRFKGGNASPPPEPLGFPATAQAQGLAGQIEARLTNVVVAALKEAFDRDHARLELERGQLEEERRRAAAALQAELRRLAIDRELSRLRLLAGAAMVGWIASVAVLAGGLAGSTTVAKSVLAGGWLLLLGALGAAFMAQGKIGASQAADFQKVDAGAAGVMALWLLIAGLAATAVSLLL